MAEILGVRFNLLEKFFAIAAHALNTARASISGVDDFTAIAMSAAAADGFGNWFVDNNGDKAFPPMSGAGTTTYLTIAEALAGQQLARIGMSQGYADGDVITVLDGAAVWTTPVVYASEQTTQEWLDYCFGSADVTPPANLYAGVLQGLAAPNWDPTGAGSYVEWSGTGYARVNVDGIWEVVFGSDAVGEFYRARSTGPVSFAPVTPGWTTGRVIALFDTSTPGTGRIYGLINTGANQTVDGGGNLVISTGNCQVSLENSFLGGTRAIDWFSVQPGTINTGTGVTITPGVSAWIDHARGIGGRLLIALAVSGVLTVRRHNDSVPDGFTAATSIESSGVTACSIVARRSGIVDLLYCHSGAVKHRTSRDQGVTFSVATTIASGYDCVAHWLDEGAGMLVAMLWKSSDATWYVTVGTLGDDGVTWTFSTPASVVAGKKAGASLQRRDDGTHEFAYVTSGGAAAMLRAKALLKTGAGSWS